MRRVAASVGIRAPSLYKHFPDKAALEHALIAEGLGELVRLIASWQAERGGDLARIARGYRRYAQENRHLYRLMTERELDRRRLPAGIDESAEFDDLMGGHDRARAAWAFAHGMVVLELANRFPPGADLDAAWASGVEAFSRS